MSMGTTPVYGLPYPNGTDLVIQGDDAMQSLAEAVEDMYASESAYIGYADANITGIAASTPWTATFPGTQHEMSGFSYSAGALSRVGTPRLFMVVAEVTVKSTLSSPDTFVESLVTLHANNGSRIAESYDRIAHSGSDISQRIIKHRICFPIGLGNTDFLTLRGSSSAPTEIRETMLRVYPIGPREES